MRVQAGGFHCGLANSQRVPTRIRAARSGGREPGAGSVLPRIKPAHYVHFRTLNFKIGQDNDIRSPYREVL